MEREEVQNYSKYILCGKKGTKELGLVAYCWQQYIRQLPIYFFSIQAKEYGLVVSRPLRVGESDRNLKVWSQSDVVGFSPFFF